MVLLCVSNNKPPSPNRIILGQEYYLLTRNTDLESELQYEIVSIIAGKVSEKYGEYFVVDMNTGTIVPLEHVFVNPIELRELHIRRRFG